MAVEEELKKDHSDMQAVVDSKQKIIEAQVHLHHLKSVFEASEFTTVEVTIFCPVMVETGGSAHKLLQRHYGVLKDVSSCSPSRNEANSS